MKRTAPAAARNRDPILDVLREVLPAEGLLLEIASGSGEHALWFSTALPRLRWQPTDRDPAAVASIAAWRDEQGPDNLLAPIELDVTVEPWPVRAADAILCVNMVHISPWSATEALFRGARRLLPRGAPLVLYGPYTVGGAHTAPSNAVFDADLRARNPEWGVRDTDAVRRLGAGLTLERTVTMPANNLTLVFRRA